MSEALVDLLIDWRLSLVARNRSDGTIRDYLATGEAFAMACQETDPERIGRRHIERWLTELAVKLATRAKHYRNLQQLFRFLVAEEIITRSPTVKAKELIARMVAWHGDLKQPCLTRCR